MQTADDVFIDETAPAPKKRFPRGQQPTRNRNRSRYTPHHSTREQQRRQRQIENGQLQVDTNGE
jgi:hypothetical protein